MAKPIKKKFIEFFNDFIPCEKIGIEMLLLKGLGYGFSNLNKEGALSMLDNEFSR